MARPLRGRDVGAKLVEALGLPVADCLSAEIILPADGIAQAVLRYKLTAEAMEKLAGLLQGSERIDVTTHRSQRQETVPAARPGSNGPAPSHRPSPPPNPPAPHDYQPREGTGTRTPPGAK